MFSKKFIAATQAYCTHEEMIPAPLLRRSFVIEELPRQAKFTVCGLGFYKLYLNGKEITNGYLASFQANPDQVLYYDEYDLTELLQTGENVLGLVLGNGFLNCIGGQVWDFDCTAYRSAPKAAFALETEQGVLFEADERVKTNPSPILFNDLREGEHYDARLELDGWANVGFDDSAWENAIGAVTPLGAPTVSAAPTLQVMETLAPKKMRKYKNGYIYDFGENTSGFARATFCATAGQELTFIYFERLGDDNGVYLTNIGFEGRTRDGFNQQVEYICKDGKQTYEPSFSWCGYRYLFIQGLTEEQAKTIELTALGIRSSVQLRGSFSCSDTRVNTLMDMILRSDLTNLFHYPVDCPQREKNGWTADAALSCEQMLLQMNIEDVHREWLKSIRAVQTAQGELPGIVPTGGWGFEWGNGPAWDCVLFWLPYYAYQYRGDIHILKENAEAMYRYLQYMSGKRAENGLVAYGLGDWCQTFVYNESDFETPLEITDSLVSYDLCKKAAKMFGVLGKDEWKSYAEALGEELAQAFKQVWLAEDGYTVKCKTQTAQSMAIASGIFAPEQRKAATEELVCRIEAENGHFRVGVVGGYSLFTVLGENGYAELAHRMIMTPVAPSYGYLVDIGETTLWENFYDFGESKSNVILKNGWRIRSNNHHFWGFIYAYYVRCVAGLLFNPNAESAHYAEISPNFIDGLTYAEASYGAPDGEISVRWEKLGDEVEVRVRVPENMQVKLCVNGEEEMLSCGEHVRKYPR